MINRFFYQGRRNSGLHLAFDPNIHEQRIAVYHYLMPEQEINAVGHFAHCKISRGNIGSWVGWNRPSVEYLRNQISRASLDNHTIEWWTQHRVGVYDDFLEWSQTLYDAILNKWDMCETCESWYCPDPNNEEAHFDCPNCGYENRQRDQMITMEIRSSVNCERVVELIEACDMCEEDVITEHYSCEYSGQLCEDPDLMLNGDDYMYCESHFDDVFTYCNVCDGVIRHDASWGTQEHDTLCHECYIDGGGCDCESCDPRSSRNRRAGVIQSWDYRPHLQFHPPVPTNPKKPLYIGLELEISFGNYDWQSNLGCWYNEGIDQDLIYIKSDSSVSQGCEFVTHPMEPRWALKNFPFEKFNQLITNEWLQARESHDSAGTHIHMNKEAFTQAHLWKFLQVHYRLPKFLRVLGGRGDTGYASFGQADNERQRKDLMKIVKEKDKGQNYDRYCAVNLRNEHTVELRYPASGTSEPAIRKNIELALALYEFSDFITVEDVKDGAIDDPGYLLHWIRSNDYPALTDWIDTRIPKPRQLKARTV